MDHLSVNIGDRIGALELGDRMAGHADDMLEKAANGLYPQSHNPNCPPQPTQACTIRGLNCVSDDALEAASAELALSPTSVQFGCRTRLCAGDDALESAGAYLNPPPMPTQVRTGCSSLPTLGCRIDDGALEAAGAYLNPPPQPTQMRMGCGLPPTLVCRIDDGALESAGVDMNPPPSVHCGGFTAPPVCRFVDDDALEAAGGMALGPTAPGGCPLTGRCRIDDGALEAAGMELNPGPTFVATGCLPRTQLCR